MKDLSITTLVAVCKIVLILVAAIGIMFGFVRLTIATAVMVFVGQGLSALGLWQAQDARPPDPKGLEPKV